MQISEEALISKRYRCSFESSSGMVRRGHDHGFDTTNLADGESISDLDIVAVVFDDHNADDQWGGLLSRVERTPAPPYSQYPKLFAATLWRYALISGLILVLEYKLPTGLWPKIVPYSTQAAR